MAIANPDKRRCTPSPAAVPQGSHPATPPRAPGLGGKRSSFRNELARPHAPKSAHVAGDGPSMLIASWERFDSRSPIIEDACSACGALIHRLTTFDQLAAVTKSRAYAAAIVSLHELAGIPDCGLSVVGQLKGAGLSVIAHEPGVSVWPVSARCRVLLAGARYLLDSEDCAFGENLQATLADLLSTLEVQRSEESRIRSIASSHGIVGESESLLGAVRSVVRMSKLSDLPVLITGESGTGKELFASALHALDPKRYGRPLVAVNCAAINAGIAESELFGHVRGAFTSAGHDHSGFFLTAQGGVLFLDEIGELNLDVQAKILRVLQEKRLYRVGAGHDAAVDIRIVAATNQDLPRMVQEGRFRSDLFHRLNTLSIHIAPLRERKADLPLLVEHFVASHASWREHTGIDADLIDALSCLELKGNVRELKNLLIAAQAAKDDHRPLGLKDLPPQVWKELAESGFAVDVPRELTPNAVAPSAPNASPTSEAQSLALSVAGTQGWNLTRCLCQCEREIVAAAMRQTRNNQSQAARLLGLTPRSVYNKLRKYDLLHKSGL